MGVRSPEEQHPAALRAAVRIAPLALPNNTAVVSEAIQDVLRGILAFEA